MEHWWVEEVRYQEQGNMSETMSEHPEERNKIIT